MERGEFILVIQDCSEHCNHLQRLSNLVTSAAQCNSTWQSAASVTFGSLNALRHIQMRDKAYLAAHVGRVLMFLVWCTLNVGTYCKRALRL